jgi:hypothetical protein
MLGPSFDFSHGSGQVIFAEPDAERIAAAEENSVLIDVGKVRGRRIRSAERNHDGEGIGLPGVIELYEEQALYRVKAELREVMIAGGRV